MDLVLAMSKAGHDQGQYYVVLGEDADYLTLVNGETKTIAKPKRKKKIHSQIIKKIPNELVEIAEAQEILDDLSVKRILKIYSRRNKDV